MPAPDIHATSKPASATMRALYPSWTPGMIVISGAAKRSFRVIALSGMIDPSLFQHDCEHRRGVRAH
jgi:hypothetical protein